MTRSCRTLGFLPLAIVCFAVCDVTRANFKKHGDFTVAPGMRFVNVQEDLRSGFIYFSTPLQVANGISFPSNNFDYFAPDGQLGYSELTFLVNSTAGVGAIRLQASGVYSASGGSSASEAIAVIASVLDYEVIDVDGSPYPTYPTWLRFDDAISRSLSSTGESHVDVPWNIDIFMNLNTGLAPGQRVTSAAITAHHQAYLLPGAVGTASVRTDSVQITAYAVPEPTSLTMCVVGTGAVVSMVHRSRRH
ncbi:hypothetical protein [Lacipirellula sp.]|uniref:hypothetical protein n=1 Tax=Lacipirellula sp. TaxID=2691419 RepID=UPI003D0E3927